MRRGVSPPPSGRVALRDGNVIDAPALAGHAAVAAHPPAQDIGARVRQSYRCVDKPARVSGPCLAASEGIATATADRPVVTATDKRATGGNDVLKG